MGGSFSVNYDHETQRDLLTTIDAKWSTTSRTRYDYTYNGLGQRVTAKQSGSAFDDFGGSTYYRYVYNGRGEVTQAVNYLGEDPGSTSSPQLTGRRFGYAHDTIGNRTSATRALGTSVSDLFSANALNQYSSRENDVTYVAGTAQTDSAIAVTGGTAAANIGRAGRYWGAEVTVANANHPAKADLTLSATLPGNLVRTENRAAYLAQALQTFSYDHDGNLTGDGIWSYVYDGENRLVQMTTTATAVSFGFPNRTLEFKYDYLGRRVQKRSATANANTYRRYLYDGWNLVAEFDAPGGVSCGALLRSYTWGLDLAGSPSATGGVGALVQITDHGSSTSYFPTYDGNGNVASLLNAADGSVAAKYEYSPFGELLRAEGAYASSNPFRFSTKFTDDESGLVYYGHRYYDPKNGRFINRDPISESGGLNLYGFCGNDGVNGWEYLGLFPEGSVASGDQRAVDDSMIGDPRRPFADSSGVIHPRNEPVTTAGPAGTAVQLGQEAGARIRNSGPNPNEKKGSEADQAARFAAQGLFAKPAPNSIAAERARIWAGARPGSTIYAGDMDDEIPYEGYDSIDRAIRAAREAQAYRIIMETPEFQMLEMELKAFMSLHPAGALNNTLHEPTNPWNYVELATTSGGGQIIRVGGVVVGVVVIKAGKPVVRLAKQAMFNAMRFHHAWPKYLGGRISQILEPLPKALHDVYHSGLDKILPRQASKAHYDSLSPKAFEQALRDLKAYTQAFDAKYGTSLYEAMVREGFPF